MFELVLFDVDDVVIDTDAACAAAERSIAEPLSRYLPAEVAKQVAGRLSDGYEILKRQLRRGSAERPEEFVVHEEKIKRWQRGVLGAGFELKLWSRDSLVAIALEETGVPVTHELVAAAVDHYWRVLAEQTRVYRDAIEIIEYLRGRGLIVHLSTNSDGFLYFDKTLGGFAYDPPAAVAKKLARLTCIEELGLTERDVSVGDPIGKPKAAFYEKVLDEVSRKVGRTIDPTRVLPCGDSLTNDVLPLFELGATHGAWLVRAAKTMEPLLQHPGVYRISTLAHLRESIFAL